MRLPRLMSFTVCIFNSSRIDIFYSLQLLLSSLRNLIKNPHDDDFVKNFFSQMGFVICYGIAGVDKIDSPLNPMYTNHMQTSMEQK